MSSNELEITLLFYLYATIYLPRLPNHESTTSVLFRSCYLSDNETAISLIMELFVCVLTLMFS
jgi:hypothetical protein